MGGVWYAPPAPVGVAGGPSEVDGGNPTVLPDAGAAGTRPGSSLEGEGDASLGASPEPPGCLGSALVLDGATFASLPRVVENDFTLEAWVKTTESLEGESAFYGRALFDADVIGMGVQGDFIVAILNDRVALGIGGPDTTVQGTSVVTNDQWVHVAVTRTASSGQLQVVVNGALEAIGTSPNRAPLTGRPDLALGGFIQSRRFIGAIDEVRIWNVARSVEQIAINLRVRVGSSESGLVGYYQFEDQGSARAEDRSTRVIPATLTENPQYVPSVALCAPPDGSERPLE